MHLIRNSNHRIATSFCQSRKARFLRLCFQLLLPVAPATIARGAFLNLALTFFQPHLIVSPPLPFLQEPCITCHDFAALLRRPSTMTDIQQWRRKIQPTRTRTPAVDFEEADGIHPPMTPRKGLKPKFSSYFMQHANGAGTSKKESPSPRNDAGDFEWPTWPAEDPYPSPDADVLIDSVMCRILGSPYEGLHPRFNGVLLQIFEGFRSLADEKQRLLAKSEHEVDRVSEMERVMQRSAKQWNREKQEYKAEIKRLELLLAKGKGGLAEVTLARQDSLLRLHQAEKSSKARKHDTLETIFQFMEKNKKNEERVWNHQRGECSITKQSYRPALIYQQRQCAGSLPPPT